MPGTNGKAPRLFGTDGVRGRAGTYPLDPRTVRRLGAALVQTLRDTTGPARILVGRDTRESGDWIEAELATGAAGLGAIVTSAGVVPTPAIAYLTRSSDVDLGVVISASHNQYEDNGIKVFSGHGQKFTETIERVVERTVADESWTASEGAPASPARADLSEQYLDHLRSVLADAPDVRGLKVAIDCANGATTTVAPALFRSVGLEPRVLGANPNGRNINDKCGSTHPETLARAVVESSCDLGIAFDGDGDRAIFVDHLGRIVNGDAVMMLCARQMKQEGRLRGNALVATVMSNIGLELALRDLDIELVRCAVGDKYVMEEMLARNLSLGGEQSGHVIFSDYLFTGDGLCTALNVMRVMTLSSRSLADLSADLVTYPQVLVNVPVRARTDLATVPAIAAVLEQVQSRVEGNGRLLVRYSGTEPLLRVMLEGQHEDQIRAWAQEIASVVTEHLGT